MSKRVKEILSWYSSENPGVRTNLARMLLHGQLGGTGRMVILPVDQGFEHGPARSFAVNPPAYDPLYHFQLAIDAGCNAYAAPLGFIEAGAAEYAGEIPLILKMNNHDVLHDEKDPLSAVTASVKDAQRLGCVAAGFTIYPGSANAQAMYQQCREMIAEARACRPRLRRLVLPAGLGPEQGGGDRHRRGGLRRPDRRPARRARHQDQAAHGAHRAAEAKKAYQKAGWRSERLAERVRHVVQSAFDGKRIVIFSGRRDPGGRRGPVRGVPRHPRRRRVRQHHRPQLVPAPARACPHLPRQRDEDLRGRDEVARLGPGAAGTYPAAPGGRRSAARRSAGQSAEEGADALGVDAQIAPTDAGDRADVDPAAVEAPEPRARRRRP